MKPRGAYLLPAIPQPADHFVFCVYVPKDIDHLLAFWGSLDYLAKWVAWEPDPAHTGILAAAAWKAANELTRQSFNTGECAERINEVTTKRRVKPGEPWITQESYDNEVTWRDVLIQPHWPAPSTSNPLAGTDASDTAALIYREWFIRWVAEMRDGIDLGTPKATIVNAIMGQLGAYAATPQTKAALEQAYDALFALSGADQDALADIECKWNKDFLEAREEIEQRGDNWLDQLSDWLTNILNDLSADLSNALNAAATTLGGSFGDWLLDNSGGGGGGGGASFGGGDCGLYRILDEQFSGPMNIVAPYNFDCRHFAWDVPDGWRVVGLRVEYSVSPFSTTFNGLGLNSAYGSDNPTCDAVPGGSYIWEATGTVFNQSTDGLCGIRIAGEPESMWSDIGWQDIIDNGYQLTDATVVEGPATAVTPLTLEAQDGYRGIEVAECRVRLVLRSV